MAAALRRSAPLERDERLLELAREPFVLRHGHHIPRIFPGTRRWDVVWPSVIIRASVPYRAISLPPGLQHGEGRRSRSGVLRVADLAVVRWPSSRAVITRARRSCPTCRARWQRPGAGAVPRGARQVPRGRRRDRRVRADRRQSSRRSDRAVGRAVRRHRGGEGPPLCRRRQAPRQRDRSSPATGASPRRRRSTSGSPRTTRATPPPRAGSCREPTPRSRTTTSARSTSPPSRTRAPRATSRSRRCRCSISLWRRVTPTERAVILARIEEVTAGAPANALRRAYDELPDRRGPSIAVVGSRLALIADQAGDAAGAAKRRADIAPARAALGLPRTITSDRGRAGDVGRRAARSARRGRFRRREGEDRIAEAVQPPGSGSRPAHPTGKRRGRDRGPHGDRQGRRGGTVDALAQKNVIAIVGPIDGSIDRRRGRPRRGPRRAR